MLIIINIFNQVTAVIAKLIYFEFQAMDNFESEERTTSNESQDQVDLLAIQFASLNFESGSDSWDEERIPSPNKDENQDTWPNLSQNDFDIFAQNFTKQHILGNCHPEKPINTVADFDKAQYKALAHYPSQRK